MVLNVKCNQPKTPMVPKNEKNGTSMVPKNEKNGTSMVPKNEKILYLFFIAQKYRIIMKKYIQRNIDSELLSWKKSENRKPLLLRGARQVGKTATIRNFGEKFQYFLEIDLNDMPEVRELFERSFSPQEICSQISLIRGIPIIPNETLLFIDEIQACPAAINKLRYFYEQYPELHLIAAGSLLEFALEGLPSFGVGRVRSIYMYPFSFDEFLFALDEKMLVMSIREASPERPLPEIVHNKINNLLRVFLIIGGMPESVSQYVVHKDLLYSQQVLTDLLVSFRADFSKYRQRVPASRISEVFDSVAQQSQGKFVFRNVESESSVYKLKQALELLIMAGLVYPVTHSAANGIPLGAELNAKIRRMIVFDIGLLLRILDMDASNLLLSEDFNVINKGALAEVFIGTELKKAMGFYYPKDLYFWHREKTGSQAEVDYLIQQNNIIVPIEVKSGVKGSMQSLWIFMKNKGSEFGVRTSMENFALYDNIKVYPLYAISNLLRE